MENKRNADSRNLRDKAEKRINSGKAAAKKKTSSSAEHELEVYKVELEMQNDELLSTQSKLRISIDEYIELFNLAPVGFFILDRKGVIINVNNTGITQLGIQRVQLVGKSFSSFFINMGSQDDYYRHRTSVIETGKKQQFECEIRKSDGSFFFALVETLVVADDQHRFKHFLSTVSDISLQKKQERMLEAALLKEKELNEMKSQFITIASHEFRTPLAAILTSTELIQQYDKLGQGEKKVKHYQRIKNSVSRLKEILIDFLSADEIEKGKIKNNPETFNIIDFTDNLLEELKSYNGIHNVIRRHVGPFEDVFLDKKLLSVCLTNLIINAYKYSPNGGAVEIITEQIKKGNLLISIRDEGIGIPEEDKPQIFEQFYRAKNAEAIQGTGLGLNVTRELVGIMGGNISFISKINIGSTFFLNFPTLD